MLAWYQLVDPYVLRRYALWSGPLLYLSALNFPLDYRFYFIYPNRTSKETVSSHFRPFVYPSFHHPSVRPYGHITENIWCLYLILYNRSRLAKLCALIIDEDGSHILKVGHCELYIYLWPKQTWFAYVFVVLYDTVTTLNGYVLPTYAEVS